MSTENPGFQPGQSGNPAGRPKGSRNKTTVALEKILDGDAEAILSKAVTMAKDGDPVAMRLCLDRIIPVRRDRPITFTLPPIEKPADLTRATHALMQGVAAGEITPSEAAELSKLVDAHVNAIKTADLAERLARIEEGGL